MLKMLSLFWQVLDLMMLKMNNTLYPQYNVDPRAGGITDFTEGRPIPGVKNSRLRDYTGESLKTDWENYQKDQNKQGLDANYTAFRDLKGLGRSGRRSNESEFMNEYSRQQRTKRGY